MKSVWAGQQRGFTIVELLIVVVVIAILAAITIVAYNGVQDQARQAKIKTDLTNIEKAVMAARNSSGLTMRGITGSSYSASNCTSLPAETDLAALSRSHGCWTAYLNALNTISAESGINISTIVDPWGRPYFIDENEGEGGGCSMDTIGTFAVPFNGTVRLPNSSASIPISGNSGC